MLQNGFLGSVLSALPNIKLSDLPNLGITNGMTPPGDKSSPPSKFANWMGTSDRKVMAKNLMDLGMEGANQIYEDNPNPNDPNSIKHSQGDWKIAAVQKILEKAYDKGIRDPTTALANKKYLLSGLDQPYQDAINTDTFNNIHKNFWQVIANKILPMQWAKYDAENKTQVAKK